MPILNDFQGYYLTCYDSGLLSTVFDLTVSGQPYFLCRQGQVKVHRLLNSYFV